MPLPNITGQQNAGVNPLDVQQKNDQYQRISNTLQSIEMRLGNITNVRSNIQSGVFGAFGNNFITRTFTQLSDGIADSISSLLSQEDEQEDPVAVAITKLATSMAEVAQNTKELVTVRTAIEDNVALVRDDIKASNDASRDNAQAQTKLLNSILITLQSTSSGVAMTQKDRLKERRKARREPKPIDAEVIPPSTITDSETTPTVDSSDTGSDKKTPEISLLRKILAAMFKSNKFLSALVKAAPLSTREAELASKTQPDTTITDVEPDEPPKSKGFDWSRLIGGLTDFDANLRGLKNIFKMAGTVLTAAFNGLLLVLGPLKKMIVGLGSIIFKAITGIGGMLAKLGIGALGAAIAPMAALYGATNLVENAKLVGEDGKLSTEGKAINTIQTAVGGKGIDPATRMTPKTAMLERIEADANAGISWLPSSERAAHKRRYIASFDQGTQYTKEEAAALKKGFGIDVPLQNLKKDVSDIDSKLNQIQLTQEEIKLANKTTGTAAPQQAPVMVQTNNNTNNQTILSTRQVTENPDRSFLRYQESILSY